MWSGSSLFVINPLSAIQNYFFFFFVGERGVGEGGGGDKALFLNYFKFSGERVHSQGRQLSGFCFPIWKGVCSKRKEFAPGEQILPFESRPLSEGPWCAG